MIKTIGEYLLLHIFIRGLISPFVVEKLKKYIIHPLGNWSKHRLIKTERELAVWMHYQNKRRNPTHDHNKRIIQCDDGLCRFI